MTPPDDRRVALRRARGRCGRSGVV